MDENKKEIIDRLSKIREVNNQVKALSYEKQYSQWQPLFEQWKNGQEKSYQEAIEQWPVKVEEWEERLKTNISNSDVLHVAYCQRIQECIQKLDEVNAGYVAVQYLDDVHSILEIIEAGRADTYKEALNLLISDQNANRMLHMQEEANNEQKRHNEAMEEQTNIHNKMVERQNEEANKLMKEFNRLNEENNRLTQQQIENNQAWVCSCCGKSIYARFPHDSSPCRGGKSHSYRRA